MITKRQKINWQNPIDIAQQISCSNYNDDWIFLYSGLSKTIKNSKSYIGLYPKNKIISDDFKELEKALNKSGNPYFGYLGYELKNKLEKLKNGEKSFIDLPNLWMMNFGLILEFDHERKDIILHHNSARVVIPDLIRNLCNFPVKKWIPDQVRNDTEKKIIIKQLSSNFSKKEYLQKVKSIQKDIEDGKLYQANLTRKFFGKFSKTPKNPFDIFLKLNSASPANYSAFLKLDNNYIISSSPELFLKIDQDGNAISSPIKGTAKRFKDSKLDQKSKENLQKSPKEQAENLMIVDLVRNDFSQVCKPSSVVVQNLFKVSSYKTVHHLSSDICGVKKEDSSNLDLIKACFPPGSMTGAPKIKAMEICQKLEKQNRGIYSGAIGIVSNQDTELSVVIRTLIIKDNKFEFQVGGAITFDSKPQSEWQETINKAKGISKTLGIKLAHLKEI